MTDGWWVKQSSQGCEIQVQSLCLVYAGNITCLSLWFAIWKANLDLVIIAPIFFGWGSEDWGRCVGDNSQANTLQSQFLGSSPSSTPISRMIVAQLLVNLARTAKAEDSNGLFLIQEIRFVKVYSTGLIFRNKNCLSSPPATLPVL